MWKCRQKDCQYESDTSRGKHQRLQPATLGRDHFVEAVADARQERSRYFGVGGDVKAGIDGGEEGLFLFECGAAGRAGIEVRAQFASWIETGGGGFDQRVFIMFAWHRNFSANCLRA
jgi:hypothetical protein